MAYKATSLVHLERVDECRQLRLNGCRQGGVPTVQTEITSPCGWIGLSSSSFVEG